MQSDGEDGTFVGRVPTGCQRSHEHRLHSDYEDVHFVGRVPTGCQRSHEKRLQSDGEDVAILSEGFLQDVREVKRTNCKNAHQLKGV